MPTQMGSDRWWVFGNGRVHGPFTRVQMIAFTQEGRIVSQTMVRAHTDHDWRAARDVAWLAGALMSRPAPTAALANDRESLAHARKAFGHLLVWADLRSNAGGGLASAISALGHHAEIAPGLWAIQSHRTAEEARQILISKLGIGDRLLVVDAGRDRIGWVNLGPETEARLKALWRTPAPPPPANAVGTAL
jgi:hypothetical protein